MGKQLLPYALIAASILLKPSQGSPKDMWPLNGDREELLYNTIKGVVTKLSGFVDGEFCPLLSSHSAFGSGSRSFYYNGEGRSVADLEVEKGDYESFSFTMFLKPDPAAMASTLIFEYHVDKGNNFINRVRGELVGGRVKFIVGNLYANTDYGSLESSVALSTAVFNQVLMSVEFSNKKMYLQIGNTIDTLNMGANYHPFKGSGILRVGDAFTSTGAGYRGHLTCVGFFDLRVTVGGHSSEFSCSEPYDGTGSSCPLFDPSQTATTSAALTTAVTTPEATTTSMDVTTAVTTPVATTTSMEVTTVVTTPEATTTIMDETTAVTTPEATTTIMDEITAVTTPEATTTIMDETTAVTTPEATTTIMDETTAVTTPEATTTIMDVSTAITIPAVTTIITTEPTTAPTESPSNPTTIQTTESSSAVASAPAATPRSSQPQPVYLWPLDNVTGGYDIMAGSPSLTSLMTRTCFRTDTTSPDLSLAKHVLLFDGSLDSTVKMEVGSSPWDNEFTVVVFVKPQQPPEGLIWSYCSPQTSLGISRIEVSLRYDGSLMMTIWDTRLQAPCGEIEAPEVFINVSRLSKVIVGRNASAVKLQVDDNVWVGNDSCPMSTGNGGQGLMEVGGRGEGESAGYRGHVVCMAVFSQYVSTVDDVQLLSQCGGYDPAPYLGVKACNRTPEIRTERFKLFARNKAPDVTTLPPMTTFQTSSVIKCASRCMRTQHCKSFTFSSDALTSSCSIFDFVTLTGLGDSKGNYYEITSD